MDDELVCSPADVGLRLLDVHRLAATPRTEGVVDRLLFLVASRVSREQEAIVVAVRAWVILLAGPRR